MIIGNPITLGGGSKPKKLLSSLTEGSLVSVLEDGKLTPFYVAKHDYEADLNGEGRTLLVRKDLHSQRVWHNSNYDAYASSDIDAWLNGDYKNMLSGTVQAQMGLTILRYTPSQSNKTVTTLNRTVFIPSVTEFGLTYNGANVEGSALPIASALRVAYLNGVAYAQWTRSPYLSAAGYACFISTTGTADAHPATNTYKAVRPCFTLPADMALNTEPYADGSWGLADEADVVPETYFPQLLWTNANPTSSFPAQTLTLATGYSGYVVEVKGSIWGDTYGYGLLFCDGSVTYPCIGVRTAETGAGNSYERWINSVSYGSISFGLANGSYSDAAIPTRIWGVNLSM